MMNILLGLLLIIVLAGLTQLLHLMIHLTYPMALLMTFVGLGGVGLYFVLMGVGLLLLVQYRKAPYGK